METDVLPFFLGISNGVATSLEDTKFNYQNILYFLLGKDMIYTYVFFILSSIIYLLIRHSYIKQEQNLEEQNKNNDDNEEFLNKLKVKRIFLRNFFIFFIFIGLFFIWKDEIKTTFFSISFAIMAIVVLFKEFLQNILSSITISINGLYKIGDMIEVKGKIGVVTDRTMFNTKVMLKNDGLSTGQEYIVPNYYFINNETVLLTKLGNYSIQFLDVHIDKKKHLLVASKALKEAAEEITINYKNRGEKLNNWKKQIKKKESVEVPSHKPFVTMHPNDKPYLTLKFACDLRYSFIVRQEILEKFYQIFPIMLYEHEEELKKEIEEIFDNKKKEEKKNEVDLNQQIKIED